MGQVVDKHVQSDVALVQVKVRKAREQAADGEQSFVGNQPVVQLQPSGKAKSSSNQGW